MVKTPRTRHSKSAKQPVMIDLEAEKVAEGESDVDKEATDDGRKSDQDTPQVETAEAVSDDAAAPEDTPAADKRDEDHPEAPREVKRRTSIMSLLTAGLIGGVIVLGGNAVLTESGFFGGDETDTGELSALRDDLAKLRGEMQANADAARNLVDEAVSGALSDMGNRISAVAGEVDSLKSDIEQLRGALEAGAGGAGAALQALKDRLDALETNLAGLAEGAAGSEASSQLLASLRADLDALAELAGVTAEKAAGAAESAASNTASIEALQGDLDALARTIEQQGSNPEVALAIAAAALKSAIDRGLPFMTELETYAAIAPDSAEVAALRELAASGVPTRSEIALGINEAANAMLAAVSSVDEDAGFFERLFASAQSMIKVRPIGMVEGDTPGAIIARMEVAIKGNNYAQALSEYESLPENAKAAGESFVAKINARMKADEIVDAALASALKPANG